MAPDGTSIAAILNALIPSTTIEWTEELHDERTMVGWLAAHPVVLVATDEEGDVIGVAAYGWFRDAVARPGYRFTVEHTVHVHRDHWRRGVGRVLMERLIHEARRNGMHTMVGAVDSANHASIRFHERLGFVESARMPGVGAKFGRWLDLVLLQLRLDERPAPPGG